MQLRLSVVCLSVNLTKCPQKPPYPVNLYSFFPMVYRLNKGNKKIQL
jgi:hypothetical protein